MSCSSARSASSRPCSTCCAPCPSPTPSSCWPSVVVTGCDTGSKSARASCRETEPSRLRLRPRRIFWRQDRPRSKFCRPKPRLKFWPLDRAETFSLSEPRLRPRKNSQIETGLASTAVCGPGWMRYGLDDLLAVLTVQSAVNASQYLGLQHVADNFRGYVQYAGC